eukprot:NODE_2686_length_1120_cov_20.374622_g2564_i0.p1 GENE.NODE_2686_length_1120_cov_20.374622_g2564_i0~~NODE_2686_length_1120_cov_20.374622_g2564_i0.p1  ORF type:complete len:315 (+),score=64.86 NODE_2686_length_1120_cov_20.374622_g2564_i0:74-1018(+)
MPRWCCWPLSLWLSLHSEAGSEAEVPPEHSNPMITSVVMEGLWARPASTLGMPRSTLSTARDVRSQSGRSDRALATELTNRDMVRPVSRHAFSKPVVTLYNQAGFDLKLLEMLVEKINHPTPSFDLSLTGFTHLLQDFGIPDSLSAALLFNAMNPGPGPRLSFTDLVVGLSAMAVHGPPRSIFFFRVWDMSRSDHITHTDIMKIIRSYVQLFALLGCSFSLAKLGGRNEIEAAASIFEALDVDSDGTISFEDFSQTSLVQARLADRGVALRTLGSMWDFGATFHLSKTPTGLGLKGEFRFTEPPDVLVLAQSQH